MKIIATNFPNLTLIKPHIFGDSRGWFFESWNKGRYIEAGIGLPFVQDNISYSTKNVIRGLHYQKPFTQGKLVFVLEGEVWDVVVDLRRRSPTFGKWQGFTLTGKNKEQLYVPPGFAHGFCVISDTVLFQYKCTDIYNPASERGIMWNDPDLNIPWPTEKPVISDKDTKHPFFRDLTRDLLFD